MKPTNSFQPKWTTPPGATVFDLLHERDLPVDRLAVEVQKDVQSLSRLLFGIEPLTPDWAERLSRTIGSTPSFWLRREELYRADLKRLCDVTNNDNADEWLHELPLKDMAQFGWIEKGASTYETVLNACAFFGITTKKELNKKFREVTTECAYRTSSAFPTRLPSVSAWLRQGEISAAAINCANWDDCKLHNTLDAIRSLTNEKNPAKFLPELKHLLAKCGVAMVIIRSPEGCRASGAARFLNKNKATIQLSFRYLADDQFWFTVFHEIGHLLLHADKGLLLEGIEEQQNAQAEAEADDFALKALFKRTGEDSLECVELSKFSIARLARRAGISPGVVVGQLQKRGRISFKHFNYMKVRYNWSDIPI